MIKEVILHQCVCDNCKEVIEFGDGYTTFTPEDIQDWIANDDDSVKVIDGKHICYKCLTLDDEGENEIIDLNRTKADE